MFALHRFIFAQLSNPTKGNWVIKVMNDMKELKLDVELEDIRYMSKMF